VERPGELVLLTVDGFQYGAGWGEGDELSYPMYEDLRDHNQVFAAMFCRFPFNLDASVDRSADRVRAEIVSGTYFPALGVTPAIGRVIDEPVIRASYRGEPVCEVPGRALADDARPWQGKGATGVGVRVMAELALDPRRWYAPPA